MTQLNRRAEWERPQHFEANTRKPHAQVAPNESKYTQNLNGEWDFHWVENLDEAPQSFGDLKWDKVMVPHCWEMEGYGNPIYV